MNFSFVLINFNFLFRKISLCMLSYKCFFIEINNLNVFRLRFSDHKSVFCLEKVIVNGHKQRVVVNDRKKETVVYKNDRFVRKNYCFIFSLSFLKQKDLSSKKWKWFISNPQERFIDAQTYKNLSKQILDFCQIHEKILLNPHTLFLLLLQSEDATIK